MLSDVQLSDFHKIIQTAMGWTNSHLHQFIHDRRFYEPLAPVGMVWDTQGIDFTGIKLSDLLRIKEDKMVYEYDFGDGWEHEIILEEVSPRERNEILPKCTEGARRCPPEDCGGPFGYSEMLKALKNPKHPQYEMFSDWIPPVLTLNILRLKK